MRKNALAIWEGVAGFAFETDFFRPSQKDLRSTLCSHARTSSYEVLFANWWDRLIAAGNQEEHWNISLLPPIIKIPRQRTTFVRRDFQLLVNYRTLEDAFWQLCLVRNGPADLGKMAFVSAILNGGILSIRHIAALLSITEESIRSFSGRLLITLCTEDEAGEKQETLWYPDSLTATLLVRALRTKQFPLATFRKSPKNEKVLEHINTALNELNLPYCGNNKNELLRTARVAYSFRATPMSVAYRSGTTNCQSLPVSVISRLCGWKPETRMIGPHAESENAFKAPLTDQPFFEISDQGREMLTAIDQLQFIKFLKQTLERTGCTLDNIHAFLAGYYGRLWPISNCLANWVIWLMSVENRGAAIQPSSAKRYLGAIARHLIDVAETENPLDMDPEDLESLYELAAGRIRSSQERGVFWGRVRSFHDFLFLSGVPDIDLSELDGYKGPGGIHVSANLISDTEFSIFKSAFLGDKPKYSHRIWPLIAGVLGYRCGLRRREIQTLWLEDIHLGNDPCLVIRSSKLARLKSASSSRRIPLAGLMPADEIALLTDYVEKRRAMMGDARALLLTYDHSPWIPLPSAVLFDPVTAAFQLITASSGIAFRFHHLRHSFANWLLLALLASDQPDLLDPGFPLLSSPLLSPERLQSLKKAFFPRLPGTPPTITRRNLYLVSALLGHLSPQTSLKHYLHLLDWISAQEIEMNLIERLEGVESGSLGKICGLSPSMPHKSPYRNHRGNPIRFMHQFIHMNVPRGCRIALALPATKAIDLSPILENIKVNVLPHPAIIIVLVARAIRGVDVEKLGRIHDIPPAALEAAIQSYRRMYAKQSGEKTQGELPLPMPPRNLIDREEFHFIIRSAYEAFESESNREDLRTTAEVLIRRPGPTTGRLYPGSSLERTLATIRGLMKIGVSPDRIRIDCPHNLDADGAPLNSQPTELSQLCKQGLIVRDGTSEGALSERNNGTYMLEFSDRRKNGRAEGRIRGANMVAMWIVFASAIVTSRSHR